MNLYVTIAFFCIWILSLMLVARHYKRQVEQLGLTCGLLARQREEALRGADRARIVQIFEEWEKACGNNSSGIDPELVGLLSGKIPLPMPGDRKNA